MINSASGISLDGVKSGRGELRVEMVAGESAVVAARASNPLKILVPCSRDRAFRRASAIIASGLSGGAMKSALRWNWETARAAT